jgi:hypothetical protein
MRARVTAKVVPLLLATGTLIASASQAQHPAPASEPVAVSSPVAGLPEPTVFALPQPEEASGLHLRLATSLSPHRPPRPRAPAPGHAASGAAAPGAAAARSPALPARF